MKRFFASDAESDMLIAEATKTFGLKIGDIINMAIKNQFLPITEPFRTEARLILQRYTAGELEAQEIKQSMTRGIRALGTRPVRDADRLQGFFARYHLHEDVDEGCIKLGGTDIREYKLDSLLSNISMVFQNVFLFADSIENNIKFGKPDATHEEVVRAAKSACCHDFIMALPNGYDTVIGESGATLSGGEKQRISIARAILKDTPIIILDEATSSVDPENEAELQQAIEKLTDDKTVIIIAHRLKTVRNAQQIVVIANGGIAQRGTSRVDDTAWNLCRFRKY